MLSSEILFDIHIALCGILRTSEILLWYQALDNAVE